MMLGMRKIIDSILKFKKLIITLAFFIGFFLFYNSFIVNRTLENLRFSLEQTALAYSIDDLNGLDIVMTKTVAEEMPYTRTNTLNINNLEYAKNLIRTGTSFRQLDNVKIALKDVIEKKEKTRGFILSLLDKINRAIKKNITNLARAYRRIVAPRKVTMPPVVKIELMEMIAALDKEKDPDRAISDYKDIIEKYSGYDKIPLAKLKLAYAYQRLGQNDKAMKEYGGIIKEYPDRTEADIARICLYDLTEKDRLMKEIDSLLLNYSSLPMANIDGKQQIAYDIAGYYIKILNLSDAIKFFNRAININPSSDIAIKSRLAVSWLYKQQNDFEKSASELEKIVEQKPGSEFIYDIYYQIADVYRYQNKYEESIELLKKLAESHKKDNPELTALYLFQIGASYMYDLNDLEKAQEVFAQIARDYPHTTYGKNLFPETPRGVFITYLVPRATRVVAWRAMGLLCVTGYTGVLCKFRAITKEAGFNLCFNEWLRKELPDTVGNMYVEIKGQKTEFAKDKFLTQGLITMGKFTLKGKAEWMLAVSKGRTLNMIILKAFLDRVPVPPILINRSLKGIERIIEKNIPIEITGSSIDKDGMIIDGIGSRDILANLKDSTKKLFMTQLEIEDITDPQEAAKAYALFKEKFPEIEFKAATVNDNESLFQDFFTRISLFLSFRILETVKDSKLDYERSIRTMGQLMVKRENFKVYLKKSSIITELSRYIQYEFPWLILDNFFIGINGIDLNFNENGEIRFDLNISLGYGGLTAKPNNLKVKGVMIFEIDKESKIPKWVFKEATVNDNPFPVEKLNAIAARCFDILRDDRIPIAVEEIKLYEGGMVFKGKGASDFTSKLFGDPSLFTIFQIRQIDLELVGIKRVKAVNEADIEGAFYRGKLQKTYK